MAVLHVLVLAYMAGWVTESTMSRSVVKFVVEVRVRVTVSHTDTALRPIFERSKQG